MSKTAVGDAGGYSDTRMTAFVHEVFERRTGVLAGLRVTPTSPASKSVQVSPGVLVIKGKVFFLEEDPQMLILDDNSSGSTRVDRIVATADWSLQTIRLGVLKGTPGAGAPGLTQVDGTTWQETLAQVSLVNGFATITDAEISRERTWARTFCPGDIRLSVNEDQGENDEWLLADGRAVSRTAYADLFDAIGTTHGAGDGATTFNLPNMRGRVPLVMDNLGTAQGAANVVTNAAADVVGGRFGAETHTLTESELAVHSHLVQTKGTTSSGSGYGMASNNAGSTFTNSSGSGGGGNAHNNMQPSIAVYGFIKT